MHRHADAELLTLLTTTAPPADLNKVSMYAAHLKKYREEAPLDQMLIFPIDLPKAPPFPSWGARLQESSAKLERAAEPPGRMRLFSLWVGTWH